jgi:hypothetical protein
MAWCSSRPCVTFAAVDAHAGAVLPDKVVAIDPVEEIRIGLEKGR